MTDFFTHVRVEGDIAYIHTSNHILRAVRRLNRVGWGLKKRVYCFK